MNIQKILFSLIFIQPFSSIAQQNPGIFQHIGRRDYQEDHYDCRPIEGGWWFAVYDGHGGSQVSNFLAGSSGLAYIFSQTSQNLSIKKRMKDAFAKANQLSNYQDVGSTASLD